MEVVQFTDYERITDTLMYLTDKITLGFTLALSKKMQSGERSFFHYETKYQSQYGLQARGIKRNMNYYFLISNKEIFGSGMILRPQDVELILMLIKHKVLPWFFGTQEQHAFQIVNNTLVLKKYTPVIYTQTESKFMGFDPIVYHYENSNQFAEGINISFSEGESCPMTIDKFMGLVNILKTDMYSVACSMANYVKTMPYGVNTFTSVGLGATPEERKDNWNPNKPKGFNPNSFLENSKKKGE